MNKQDNLSCISATFYKLKIQHVTSLPVNTIATQIVWHKTDVSELF